MAEQNYQETRFEPRSAEEARAADPDPAPFFFIGDEKFTCLPRSLIPAGALRRLSASVWTVGLCCDFIATVLEDKDSPDDVTPTQVERFYATLDRKDIIVDGTLLTAIVVWLIGATGRRPTSSPVGLTNGQKGTKAGSKARRSGKASTSKG